LIKIGVILSTYCSLRHSLALSSARLPTAGILLVSIEGSLLDKTTDVDVEKNKFRMVDGWCGGGKVVSSVENKFSRSPDVEDDNKSSLYSM
jgi:hypothetical protein